MGEVFKWLVGKGSDDRVYLSWFTNNFIIDDFEGIDRFLFCFLKFCDDLNVDASKKHLVLFITTEGKRVIKDNHIIIGSLASLDYKEPAALEEALRIVGDSALSQYDIYNSVPIEATDDFRTVMYEFMVIKKKEAVRTMMADSFPKLTDGTDIDDVIASMSIRTTGISQRYNLSAIDKIGYLQKTGVENAGKMRRIVTTGIPAIDQDCGGLYSTQFVAVSGQPGSGKSRFALALIAYRCAVVEKKDCWFKSLELSAAEVQNILIAIHIVNLYDGRIKIPDSSMNRGEMSPEQKKYYESAKIDLFESVGKYGKIIIDAESVCVELLDKTIRDGLRQNPSIECVVVDYLGFIRSKPQTKYDKTLGITDIISESVIILKNIARDTDTLSVGLCQYNKEGIEAALAGKRIDSSCIQGGQAVERTADYNLAMSYTEEQWLASMRTISTGKVRGAAGFFNVPLHVDLSVSKFSQIKRTKGDGKK